MTVKDKLIIYIYRKMGELEEEEKLLHYQTKHCSLDSLDHFEMMCSKIRLQAFNEFVNDLYKIVFNCR